MQYLSVMLFARRYLALVAVISILASSHVYSSDMCSAVFRQTTTDALDKTLYFNGTLETDTRIKASDKFEISELRSQFRNAYDLEIELNSLSRFSVRRLWLQRKIMKIRVSALETSKQTKLALKYALEDAKANTLWIDTTYEKNIKIGVSKPRFRVDIVTELKRLPDPEAERLAIEDDLLTTLLEIERTEKYYSYEAPSAEQITKFDKLMRSFDESKKVIIMRKKALRNAGREVSTKNLVLGKSYVAMIANGRLVIGDSYKNIEGGSSATHSQLRDHVGVADFIGSGGSVRFNNDGSVDVSGQHHKNSDLLAALKIADYVRAASPAGTIINVTPGRLSNL